MSFDYSIYEQIDRYLSGGMGAQELAEFEQLLANDAGLIETVELQKLANEFVLRDELIDLKEQMDSDFSSGKAGGGSKPFNKLWILGGALALVIGGIVMLQFRQTPSTNDSLAVRTNKVESTPLVSSESPKKFPHDLAPQKITISSKDAPIETTKKTTNEKKVVTNEEPTPTVEENMVEESPSEAPVVDEPLQEKTVPEPKQTPQPFIDPCQHDDPKLEVSVTQSSFDEDNGKIEIHSLSSGGHQLPLSFKIDDDQNFQQSSHFEYLAPGEYTLVMMDGDGCIDTLQSISIERSPCLKNYQKGFSLTYDPEIVIPVSDDFSGSATLFNKRMEPLVTITLEEFEERTWNLELENGSTLTQGYYMWQIVLESGKKCQASLTLSE